MTDHLAYTVAEASELMRVSRNTIYRMVKRGELRSVRIGRLMFIPRQAIQELYERPRTVRPRIGGPSFAFLEQ